METLAPLSPSKRIDLVDSLRGFAIFGILMVNMPAFFKPAVELIMLPSFGDSTVEILSTGFIYFFFMFQALSCCTIERSFEDCFRAFQL
ncbi:hypothetical protein [Mongoliitalea daihaiensis]|uniref:hypothetical protein n=1 Tax=Mongoliitalea daihaiensis TaxID=2782006 RepID=UPI001F29CD68|nr:hypothetical protein [Mongoliitalea daihaiensis]UJP63638.1 hypothetical protein IPZ59_12420 [Mongoliitalea daihaiensis]